MKSLLVVCEGNICRSPMAEGILSAELPGVHVRSAGLGALVGMPAEHAAIRLMRDKGIDISDHRAEQIGRKMCVDADMVLVMDLAQRNRLQKMYPEVLGRVFRVGEYTNRDIPDPYRRPEEAFRQSLHFIDEGLREWLQRIRRL